MIEALYELNLETALLALPLWLAAAVGAGRLALRRSGTAIRDCAARFVFFHADGPLLLAIVAAPR